MNSKPIIFKVTKEQVGREDLATFLREAIHKQFGDKEYYIAKEVTEEKPTEYSATPRKLRGFLINEGNSIGHSIYFDVTDVSADTNWLGR